MRSIILGMVMVSGAFGLFSASGPGEGLERPLPPLQVSLEREPINRIEPFYRAYVTSGTNKFTFLIPRGFQFQANQTAGSVCFRSRDGATSISFGIAESLTQGNAELSLPVYREVVVARHPTARILQEAARSANGCSGPAFDIQWRVSENLHEWKRLVFVPSSAGVLEFTAMGSLTNAAKVQSDLDLVLTTFTASKDGKLQVNHLSDMN